MVFEKQGNALCIRRQAEQLLIEPWGKNAFRLRGTKSFAFTGNTWALTEPLSEEDRQAVIQTQGDETQTDGLPSAPTEPVCLPF